MKNILIITVAALLISTTGVMAKRAATVNGIEITVDEANQALKILSKGKMTWEKLSKEEKKQLIEMIAPSKLVLLAAKKELTQKEKERAFLGFWMQKQISTISISDEKAKVAYEKMKKAAKAAKSKEKIPEFEEAKGSIKMQIAQEEILAKLMKKADIKIK